MFFDENRPEFDARLFIIGLGYATAVLVIVGWIASHLI